MGWLAMTEKLTKSEREFAETGMAIEPGSQLMNKLLSVLDAQEAEINALKKQLRAARKWNRANSHRYIVNPTAADQLTDILKGK
jgi:septal ring factor EnvC (AmiA/AmiB activator)